MPKEFYIENRVFYHDTDSGGVVYYARYLEHLEESRSEFFRSKGVDLAEWAKKGAHLPVVHLEVDYKAPARYGDTIRIFTRLEQMRNSSVIFSQEIKRGEAVLVKAKTVWACVGDDFKIRPLPEELKNIFPEQGQ